MRPRFIELEPENLGKQLIIHGVRYVRCRKCVCLKPVSECVIYGGSGTYMNVGLCRLCANADNERYNRR